MLDVLIIVWVRARGGLVYWFDLFGVVVLFVIRVLVSLGWVCFGFNLDLVMLTC